MKISVFHGDITDAPADAICTSTNPRLSLMMGTGAAVREKGGWSILRECEAIVDAAALKGSRHLPPGSSHITTAGSLPYNAIIHCVAGDDEHRSSEQVVRLCVKTALARADQAQLRRIAMPIFGTGHARLKFETTVRAMIDMLRQATTGVEEVVLVVNDAARAEAAHRILATDATAHTL